jgi:molecular chaperone GrpE
MQNENEQLATPSPESAGQTSESELKENATADNEAAGVTPATTSAVETSAAYEKLKEEKAALYERLLRKQAEFDNFRKRTQQEKEALRQHAAEDLIRNLLPVLDGFERALKQRTPGVPESYYQGMELILRQLSDVLARAGVEVIEASGQLFDPHFHQAVETIEDESRRDHEIVEELQRGYKLKHRLLRPAIVRVAVKPKVEGASGSAERKKTS